MKKVCVFLLCVLLPLYAYSAEKNKVGVELSLYLVHQNAFESIIQDTGGNIGVGFSTSYELPAVDNLGFSCRFEYATSYITSPRVHFWDLFTGMAGVFYNLNFTSYFTLRPEFSYGAILNFVTIEDEKFKTFVDQNIQFSLSFIVTSDNANKDNIKVFCTPLVSVSPENNTVVPYFGFNAGLSYEF